jgi:hypothetical protein
VLQVPPLAQPPTEQPVDKHDPSLTLNDVQFLGEAGGGVGGGVVGGGVVGGGVVGGGVVGGGVVGGGVVGGGVVGGGVVGGGVVGGGVVGGGVVGGGGATYRLIELLELTGEAVPAELVAVTVV